MWKIVSLRHWRHVLVRVYKLLRSPRIPLREKLWFILPALLYVVLPDVMPLVPLDDIAVSMLLANWFSVRMERKYAE